MTSGFVDRRSIRLSYGRGMMRWRRREEAAPRSGYEGKQGGVHHEPGGAAREATHVPALGLRLGVQGNCLRQQRREWKSEHCVELKESHRGLS